jgi:outer membrane protein assembly factor BamB
VEPGESVDPADSAVSTAWGQNGSDPGHSGVTTATGVTTDGAVDWQVSGESGGNPVVADGKMFHAADLGTDPDRTPMWKPTTDTGETTTPTATSTIDGVSPAADRYLVCRDARNGDIEWVRPVEVRGTPVLTDGRVVVAGDNSVVAFRADDGAEQWRNDFETRAVQVSTAIDGTILASTQILRQNDRDADVRAYRVADGSRRWKRPSPKWQADLAGGGGTVFALSSEFQVGTVLTARNLDDGSEQWSVEFDDNGLPGGPVVRGGTVYVAPDDRGLLALHARTGDQRWHYEGDTSNTVHVAASDDTAYLLDDGVLRARDATTGTEQWSASVGERGSRVAPAVDREAIYLGTGGIPADFVVLSRSDGGERWRHQLPEVTLTDVIDSGLRAQPTVVDGAVYANTVDGLYAFGPPG